MQQESLGRGIMHCVSDSSSLFSPPANGWKEWSIPTALWVSSFVFTLRTEKETPGRPLSIIQEVILDDNKRR